MTDTPARELSFDLRGRVAIVTGGGRGIGRAIALGYAAAGADVVIGVARNLAEAEDAAGAAETLPGSVQAVRADVTTQADIDRLLEAALAINGRIDVLVNNAARGMLFVNERFMTDPAPFWEADPEAWRLVMETNTVGVFLMSRAVVPHMLAAGSGSIINVTINRETMVRRGFSPYGPSKAALEAMTQVWAQELEGSGVHINLLAPGGATATGMVPEGAPPQLKLLSPEIVVAPALHLALTQKSGQRIMGTEWQGPG
ncbi:MAG TPA: SDR family oxidoreductase [Solirubrobacteraceae bacterium]|nr:SDR family oxidoreductase [Solirubrobacteraceae bacterium]